MQTTDREATDAGREPAGRLLAGAPGQSDTFSTGGEADLARGARRAIARCRELGAGTYSDIADGLYRPYLGPAHLATMDRIGGWMRQAGLMVRRDAAGSLIGRRRCKDPQAPTLLIGSHLDSVRHGGVYDGMLGVMLGLECITFLAQRQMKLPFAIEVIGFGDVEGSRFPLSMLGSRALVGAELGNVAEMLDADGVSLRTAMSTAGLDVDRLGEAARDRNDILAYLEAHIEQGPQLDSEDWPIAAVEAIAGIRRWQVRVLGEAGHAGTVPPAMRRDALVAASDMVLQIERLAIALDQRPGPSGPHGFRATVGQMQVAPGAVNVIARDVSFSFELRAGNLAALDEAAAYVQTALLRTAERRRVTCGFSDAQSFAPAQCDPTLTRTLQRHCAQRGGRHQPMVSGAGHDAMVLSDWVPSAMLFIRSPGGISHHPGERVDADDVATALGAMIDLIVGLDPDRVRTMRTTGL